MRNFYIKQSAGQEKLALGGNGGCTSAPYNSNSNGCREGIGKYFRQLASSSSSPCASMAPRFLPNKSAKCHQRLCPRYLSQMR
jgi:hypothetical protein